MSKTTTKEAPKKETAPVEAKKSDTAVAKETIAAGVAKTHPEAKSKSNVLFVSKLKELSVPIMVNGTSYKPSSDESGEFIVWIVDKKDADMFAAHSHVLSGRIQRALEN